MRLAKFINEAKDEDLFWFIKYADTDLDNKSKKINNQLDMHAHFIRDGITISRTRTLDLIQALDEFRDLLEQIVNDYNQYTGSDPNLTRFFKTAVHNLNQIKIRSQRLKI